MWEEFSATGLCRLFYRMVFIPPPKAHWHSIFLPTLWSPVRWEGDGACTGGAAEVWDFVHTMIRILSSFDRMKREKTEVVLYGKVLKKEEASSYYADPIAMN